MSSTLATVQQHPETTVVLEGFRENPSDPVSEFYLMQVPFLFVHGLRTSDEHGAVIQQKLGASGSLSKL